MRIVADENIPYVREAFEGFGEVVTAPGRAMDAALVREAGAQAPLSHMRIRREERGQDVYYWFSTQHGRLAGEYALKWDLVKNALARRPTNSAFVRFNAQERDSTALREMMQLLAPALDGVLAEAGL